jgi:hypothetical protein
MNLFHGGLPPIKNPSQPGMMDAFEGKPVVWSSGLLYPGRPQKLLKRLGLSGGAAVDIR